jgi:RNA polymerase sigma-70 factor (ECF subfamily)
MASGCRSKGQIGQASRPPLVSAGLPVDPAIPHSEGHTVYPAGRARRVTPGPVFLPIKAGVADCLVATSPLSGENCRDRKRRDDSIHSSGFAMAVATPPGEPDDTDHLLSNAAAGDSVAIERLLERHRSRLCRMIALRLDDRLAARVDASDIVQEALTDAARKLADYARDRPLPFYPWLHRLAAERLSAAHRQHRRSQCRSVAKETADAWAQPESPATFMIDSLVASGTTPFHALLREERRRHVHAALQELPPTDREILVMHYLEELSFAEIAAILDIGEGAAKMRHLRALRRVRSFLESEGLAVTP